MDAARHTREPARVALSDYTDAIRAGWTDGDLTRAILHDLPRNFRSLGREEQQQPPPPGGRAEESPYSLAPSAIITSVGSTKSMNAPDSTRPPTMLTTNGTTNIRSSPRS